MFPLPPAVRPSLGSFPLPDALDEHRAGGGVHHMISAAVGRVLTGELVFLTAD